ncbi:unnamed protein product, partial [Staurois parvus]
FPPKSVATVRVPPYFRHSHQSSPLSNLFPSDFPIHQPFPSECPLRSVIPIRMPPYISVPPYFSCPY